LDALEGRVIQETKIMMYETVENADTYFLSRLHVNSWTDAIDTNKEKALKEATARIDRLRFSGDKTTLTQTNEFPRDDEIEVPDDIKIACCEIAFSLLDGVEPEREFEKLRHSNEQFASERITYNDEIPEHIVAGIPSAYAWRFLLPYLDQFGSITLNRTS